LRFARPGITGVIADGDTGYGNPLNVRCVVREYERAGAAAVHIQDQTFPKRCGHMLGQPGAPNTTGFGNMIRNGERR
jgi:2,3-dimethylmalate lyase